MTFKREPVRDSSQVLRPGGFNIVEFRLQRVIDDFPVGETVTVDLPARTD